MKNNFFTKAIVYLLAGAMLLGSVPAYASEVAAKEPAVTAAQEEEIEYVLGRPMTEEEIAEQKKISEEAMKDNRYIPLNIDKSLDQIYVDESSMLTKAVLPAYYDSRAHQVITSVKDQSPFGTCWAFSAIALMESHLLSQQHSADIDLSEAHLVYFANNSAPEPLNNQYNDSMINNSANSYWDYGGNSYMSFSTLAAWRGAVAETTAPYENLKAGYEQTTAMAYEKDVAHLQGYYRIDKRNTNIIKTIIMERGAVGASYHDAEEYLNYNTAAYYCNDSNMVSNHAITIVGWDDNYSRKNFNSSVLPTSDGAWIVKNSWGPSWGDFGYFYISYEDMTLNEFFSFDVALDNNYDNCYQYDLTASMGVVPISASKAAAVFTAKGNPDKMEQLTAVSIAMTQSADVNYSIQIYRNPSDSSDPTSGTPLLSTPQTGSTTLAGYYTIPLNETVTLNQGDTFAVVFTFDTAVYIDYELSSDQNGYVVTASSRAGENYIAFEDIWLDLGSNTMGNLRMKAFTNNLDETSENVFADNVYRIFGATRYDTSFKIADATKASYCFDKFDTIIVASGKNFADALAGSYLAYKKQAPILMTNGTNAEDVKLYIRNTLNPGGTVYLLGGTSAVPDTLSTGLSDFHVKRLSGKTRYETNLEILKEAGVTNEELLVCTGKKFADSLSGSAVKKPILLVSNELSAAQQDYLSSLSGKQFYVLGGAGAVNETIVSQLSDYGTVERIGGSTRYETSVMIAEKFFKSPQSAVVAYAKNFPDGLCGGPLAVSTLMNSPLILTSQGKETAATGYLNANQINEGAVLGGSGLITDPMTVTLFQLTNSKQIKIW